jgi:ATP-binding cassette, subfamily F, member 3
LKESASEPVSAAASATSGESLNPKLQRKAEAQRRAELSQKTQPLRRELQKVESEMEALGSEKKALETQLTQAMPAAEIAQAGRRLKAVSDQLDALEERWLSLSEQIEQATA